MNSKLDDALDDSFPASDPPAFMTSTTATASNDVLPERGNNAKDGRLHVYRVVESRKAEQAFSATRALERRWTKNAPSIYASLTPAGAMLEFMVHLEGRTPEALTLAVATLPVEDVLVQGELLEDWNQRPYRAPIQAIGDAWCRNRRSLGLRLPSALCPDECNILINPEHEHFHRLTVVRLLPMMLDERIRI